MGPMTPSTFSDQQIVCAQRQVPYRSVSDSLALSDHRGVMSVAIYRVNRKLPVALAARSALPVQHAELDLRLFVRIRRSAAVDTARIRELRSLSHGWLLSL
jgi:hypothetical protein